MRREPSFNVEVDAMPGGFVCSATLKLKFSPKGYDRRLVAELWLYPDSTRVLELSTKCAPDGAFRVAGAPTPGSAR